MTRIVCISDTHTRRDFKVPDGDILIHAGDLTFQGTLEEIAKEAQWLKALRIGGGFKSAVLIAGNHDWLAEKDPAMMRNLVEEAGWTYLDHQPAVVQGFRFFGSGYTPRFFDWALNVDRGPKLAALWAQIPEDTQVLVTHGPPHGRLDEVNRPAGEMDANDFGSFGRGDKSRSHQRTHVGCVDLWRRLQDLKNLRLHVFGHIHRDGVEQSASGVTYINASVCDARYQATYKPKVLDVDDLGVKVVQG